MVNPYEDRPKGGELSFGYAFNVRSASRFPLQLCPLIAASRLYRDNVGLYTDGALVKIRTGVFSGGFSIGRTPSVSTMTLIPALGFRYAREWVAHAPHGYARETARDDYGIVDANLGLRLTSWLTVGVGVSHPVGHSILTGLSDGSRSYRASLGVNLGGRRRE
jgi:hypothetical protein